MSTDWANKQSGNKIFVFGSNIAGRHGAGAALYAKMYKGAVYGNGSGLQGNSYAIPTKDRFLRTLPLSDIADGISNFIKFAEEFHEFQFQVTNVGCGLAGYTSEQIAPLFKGYPPNCELSPEFQEIIKRLP